MSETPSNAWQNSWPPVVKRRLLRDPAVEHANDSDLEEWHATSDGSFRCTRLAVAPRIAATLDSVLGNSELMARILRVGFMVEDDAQKKLTMRFLSCAESVSSTWRQCVADQQLWRHLCHQCYEICIGLKGVECWKQLLQRITRIEGPVALQSLSGVMLIMSVRHGFGDRRHDLLACTLQGQEARVRTDHTTSWRAEWDVPPLELRAGLNPSEIDLTVHLFRPSDQKVVSLFHEADQESDEPWEGGKRLAKFRGQVTCLLLSHVCLRPCPHNGDPTSDLSFSDLNSVIAGHSLVQETRRRQRPISRIEAERLNPHPYQNHDVLSSSSASLRDSPH